MKYFVVASEAGYTCLEIPINLTWKIRLMGELTMGCGQDL
jgi:hypothetical protein